MGIAKRFPRASFARLFHSFWPADERSLFSLLASLFAHRFIAHLDPVSVVYQPVEDAVGQRGISDLFVPASHWQLRGQDDRARLVAIFGDFPEVSALEHRP